MAEYALVGQDNHIKAVIVADSDFISVHGDEIKNQYGEPNGSWVLTPEKIGIGYKYGSGIFISPVAPSMSIESPNSFAIMVSAVADGEKSYQWKKDGQNIQDATDATYTKDPSASGDSANYTCVVTVSQNSLTSDACEVTVS